MYFVCIIYYTCITHIKMKRTDTDFVVGSATKRNFKGKNPLLGFSSKVFFLNKHTQANMF